MDPVPRVGRRLTWIAVSLCAFGVYFVRIEHEPLWLDETYSAAMTRHGFKDLVRFTAADVHPPLYYLLLKLCTLVLGDSPAALRIPSALAGTGLILLSAGPVRRIWDQRTAWVFAVLALFSPGLLCFAQEARMYALATLLVTGAALYGQLAVRNGRRGDFVAFGVFTWTASLTHYFALVAVGTNALILLATAAKSRDHALRPLAISALAALLGFLPWAPSFWGQLRTVTQGFWIPPTSVELVVFGLVAPFTYKFEDIPYPWEALVALVLTMVMLTTTLLMHRFRGKRSETSAQVQLVLVCALTLAFGMAFSLLVRPIFMPRYMIVNAGALFAALAASIGRMPARVAVGTTLALVLLGLPAWLRIQIQTFNGPFERLASEVAAAGYPVPVLVHNGVPFSFAVFPTSHVVPHVRNVVIAPDAGFDPTAGGLYDPRRAEAVQGLAGLLDVAERIWVVDGSPGPDPLDRRVLDSDPRWVRSGADITLEEPTSWVKLTLRRYQRRAAVSKNFSVPGVSGPERGAVRQEKVAQGHGRAVREASHGVGHGGELAVLHRGLERRVQARHRLGQPRRHHARDDLVERHRDMADGLVGDVGDECRELITAERFGTRDVERRAPVGAGGKGRRRDAGAVVARHVGRLASGFGVDQRSALHGVRERTQHDFGVDAVTQDGEAELGHGQGSFGLQVIRSHGGDGAMSVHP